MSTINKPYKPCAKPLAGFVSAVALGVVLGVATVQPALAANHREAPITALDHKADITDFFAFVSYDEDNLARDPEDRRVTLIMNVNPGQEPGDGPNYFAFDDNVLYRFHVDNNADGEAEDIVYEIRFQTENRPALGELFFPLPFVSLGQKTNSSASGGSLVNSQLPNGFCDLETMS